MAVHQHAQAELTEIEPNEAEVREQLDRLLANPFFSHSKRFPMFLRFVVDRTLAGEAESIKERTLGIEIFGRHAEYDTAADPIVRVTAAEIRKRVAQYYQDPAHQNEVRITLPSGSYIPQFGWPHATKDLLPQEVEPAPQPLVESRPFSRLKAPRHSHLVLALACVAAVIASAATIFVWQNMHRSALDFFWQPVLDSKDPVLLCVADQLQYSNIVLRDAADPSHQFVLNDKLTAVVMDDVYATGKVVGVLQSRGRQYSLKGEGATNLNDLRNGPTIFVGAFDNAWTLRLTNTLRYHFANNAEMTRLSIVDRNAASKVEWYVDRPVQMDTNIYRDYAIIARFTDSDTGRLAVIAAGIGRGGTIAAGEFLTDPADLAQIERAARAAGNKTNMEIVLSTQIIDGEPGSPKVEAAYFW
jgi:hypothetical protein